MSLRLKFFTTLAALLLCSAAIAQPVAKSPAVTTAETYLKKVLAANSANSPVPSPNAAERSALATLNAQVNDEDKLEIENWPPTPLNTLKTVGQLNGLVGQLSNTGIYKTKAEQNVRDAARNEQLAAMKTRSETLKGAGGLARSVRITTTPEQQQVMRRLGWSLNDTNEIISGGKTYDLMQARPEELVDHSEPGKKKFGAAYANGAGEVGMRLANPKLDFVERAQLEEAKQARDSMIASATKLLGELRQKQTEIDTASPARKQ